MPPRRLVLISQDAEKVRQLRSQSLVSLRPCWTNFLSILR